MADQTYNPEEETTQDEPMPLLEHLADLRRALVRSILSILVLFGIGFYFSKELLNFLQQPLLLALPEGVSQNIHFTGPLDVFIASLKVSFLVAVIVGAPLWSYHFWVFLKPALHPHERKYAIPSAITSALLFCLGVSFCFFLILPLALDYLINMGMEVGTPLITINDYLSLVIMLLLAFGFVFETPIVLVLLVALDVVSIENLRAWRPFMLVGILVVAALLTPPDPISQMAMAVPLYVMYELSIVFIRIFLRKKS